MVEVPDPTFRQPKLSKRKRTERARAAKKDAYVKVLEEVLMRCHGVCEAQIEGVCLGRGDCLHHVKTRGAGGDDSAENLRYICNDGCHAWIHSHIPQAKAMGLLRGRYADG